MLGRSTGAVLLGIEARLVEVEVAVGGGLPVIAALGLPDSAVREGIDRVRASLRHCEFKLPEGRVTINLAPADVRKHGAGLDLPIALALLAACGNAPAASNAEAVMVGELALDGSLRPIRGALAVAEAARQAGRRTLLVPTANSGEAALVAGLDVVPVASLADALAFGQGTRGARPPLDAASLLAAARAEVGDEPDLGEVRGQAAARRALEIAAAGGHHLLLNGPPGAGKTMLARRLPGILPPLAPEEALEVTRIWSAAAMSQGLVTVRPFRSPHHGISGAGLTGGGPGMRPGEMSLAHCGVLFLDEMTEFRRDVLEALRQPLEEGQIRVVRVRAAARFPAAFMLVASMNPCACGHHGQPGGRCGCTPLQVRRYRGRLSGPLLDRFDLVVDVPPVDLKSLSGAASSERSIEVRQRVVAARERQRARFGPSGPASNSRMAPPDLNRYAQLGGAALSLLLTASAKLGLSARGFDRVRRVARTIADLAGADSIEMEHLAEALQYRPGDALGRG